MVIYWLVNVSDFVNEDILCTKEKDLPKNSKFFGAVR
jgi:hypothetical protein